MMKVDGTAQTPYVSRTAIFGSRPTGKVIANFLTNGFTTEAPCESREIASTTRPRSL